MTWNPTEYAAIAARLVTSQPKEGCRRAAISRYYYAAFLIARHYCFTHGLPQKHGGIHRAVPEFLRGTDLGHLSDQLEELRELRKLADYEIDHWDDPISDLSSDVGKAQRISEQIIRVIGQVDSV